MANISDKEFWRRFKLLQHAYKNKPKYTHTNRVFNSEIKLDKKVKSMIKYGKL